MIFNIQWKTLATLLILDYCNFSTNGVLVDCSVGLFFSAENGREDSAINRVRIRGKDEVRGGLRG